MTGAAILICLGLAIVVLQLFYLGRRLDDHAQLLKRLVAVARTGHLDDLSHVLYPTLYGDFRKWLRWWHREENRMLKTATTSKYQPEAFRLVNLREANSSNATSFKTLWSAVETFQNSAAAQTTLNPREIEFLWTWELTNSLLIGYELLKDDDSRTQSRISAFRDSLNEHLKSYRRDRRTSIEGS